MRHRAGAAVRRALAEAGQIQGDHVVPLGEGGEHRPPHLPAAAQTVDEDQRAAAAPAKMVQTTLLVDMPPTTVSPYAMALDYDVLVIGSGFGGSVSALRLTE